LLEHDFFQIRGVAAKEECLTAIISMGKKIMEEQGREDKIINEMLIVLYSI